jgi:flagellar assembly protein FliH
MVAMTNSSSRVLRDGEHSAVTPIQWRVTVGSSTPNGKSGRSERSVRSGKDGPSEKNAAEGNQIPQQELARIEREAYQRGFAEGQAQGRVQAGAEVQPALDRLAQSLASLTELRTRIRIAAEGDLLKLAVAIARRVVHRELTLDPASIGGLIRVALEKLQARELCRVRVHPDQETAIRGSLQRFSNSQKVEIIADSSMQCGDVLFETAHGNLDGSIESQLQEIERGLADRLERLPQNR